MRRNRTTSAIAGLRSLAVILIAALMLSIGGPAVEARAAVSGGAYQHPVECRTQTSRHGLLITNWLPWFTNRVAVRPWYQVNGQWVPLDAVMDRAGWQDFKSAYRGTNGLWYYDRFSTREGRSSYARADMRLGDQPNGSAFYARGYWYYLEFQFIDYWTGTWKSVQTTPCFMY